MWGKRLGIGHGTPPAAWPPAVSGSGSNLQSPANPGETGFVLLLWRRNRLQKCNNWSGATIRAGTPSLQGLAAPRGLVSTSWALGACVRAGQKPLWRSPVSPAGADAPSALEPAAPTLPSPGTQGRDEGPSQPHSEHFRNSGSFPSPFGEDVTESAQKESSGIWGRWRTACRAGLHAGLTPRWSQYPQGRKHLWLHQETGLLSSCTGPPDPTWLQKDKKVSAEARRTGLGASPSPGPNGDFFF